MVCLSLSSLCPEVRCPCCDRPQTGIFTMITRRVTGNYELYTRIVGVESTPSARTPVVSAPAARIRFSGSDDSVSVYLEIDGQGFRVARQAGEDCTILKDYPGGGPLPWEIRVLKKGNFFRFGVNGKTGWIRGPSGRVGWVVRSVGKRADPGGNRGLRVLVLYGHDAALAGPTDGTGHRAGPGRQPLRETDHSGRYP